MNADPKPMNPDSKPTLRRASKRQADFDADADADGSGSESRSSSRLSKRRKYSTEPSEAFNVLPTDSAASLKHLDGFKVPGLFLSPDVFAKAKEDWRNIYTAYEGEKASRKETFEAALKRATRRANDAEHKLQDASQMYADNLKAEKEAHVKALEAKAAELEAKEKELQAKEKELQAEKEKNTGLADSGDMVAKVFEKEE